MTPVPALSLVLDAEAAVAGYWSDSTATLNATISLRNEGTRRLDAPQRVLVWCTQGSESGCREELSVSLTDGYGPTTAEIDMRVPMGRMTTLRFDYGADAPLTLDVDIPERILGVERDVWECYAHRPPGGVAPRFGRRTVSGCGGWESGTVEKWLNDVPVKYWATGYSEYVPILEEVLMELAPALNLELKRVEQEEDADLRAFVGVLRAAADGYVGADEYKRLVTDSAGFASWDNNRRGETTSAYLFVWKLDDGRWGGPERDRVKKVTIHEVLHAAVPISHSSRIDSVMGGSSLKWLSPIDEALIRLNSHRLVQPGMTMEEVKALVVFRDELLDVATPPELDARGMLWRTAVQMSEAGSTKFRIRGGYPGHRCDYKFGGRREMATLEVSGLNRFLGSPRLSRFTEHKTDFFLAWSGDLGKWRYWIEKDEGWAEIDGAYMQDATNWGRWPSRIYRALYGLLNDSVTLRLTDPSDGTVTLEATMDMESAPSLWDWSRRKLVTVEVALVLDADTHALKGYKWREHDKVAGGFCQDYEEEAREVELGVEMEIPEVISAALDQ